MEITGHIEQVDLSKPKYRCRKWKLVANLNVNGKRKRKAKRVTCSWREANAELDKFLDDLENGKIRKDIKFKDYSTKWLDHRKKLKSFSSNTIDNNYYSIKRLNEKFGDYYLSQLSLTILKDNLVDVPLIHKSREGQASNSYKRKLYKTMKTILDAAVLEDYIDENPMKNIDMPKNDTKERTAYTREEFDYLINVLNERELNGFNVAIQLICYLGLRRGEVVALTWDDYDEKNSTITVNHSFKEKSRTIGEPKSTAGNRTIPLSDNVSSLLKRWRKIFLTYPIDTNYICCSNVASFIHPQNLYRWWKKTILEANNKRFNETGKGMLLKEISLHDLRHTNITLVSRYVLAFDLKDYAGWSDLGPTRIYVHQNYEALKKGLKNANL